MIKLLGQTAVTVSANEYLFDMFESDVVVRIPYVGSTNAFNSSTCGKYLVINIEVDGVHHKKEKKIKFCKLRDAYLRSQGVAVHRVDAQEMHKDNDAPLEQWLIDALAESLLLSARNGHQ
jgi:hypothetical protein